MAGLQCLNAAEDGFGRRHVKVGKEIVKGGGVQLALDPRMNQQRFDFRAQHEVLAHLRVIQRLNAQPVASCEEFPFLLVPHRKRKHPQ